MNKIRFFLIAIALIFCNCSNDDDVFIYHIPEYSLQGYYSLLGSSYNDFITKYPYFIREIEEKYSINEEQLLIKTFYKENIEKEELATYVYFKDDVCEGLRIMGHQYKEQLDLFLIIAENINKIATPEKEICSLMYGKNSISTEKKFENYQALIDWINNDLPEDEFVTKVYLKWGNKFPGNGNTTENIIAQLWYEYHLNCSPFNYSSLFLTIGNFYIPF
jgi:hypothetical protein